MNVYTFSECFGPCLAGESFTQHILILGRLPQKKMGKNPTSLLSNSFLEPNKETLIIVNLGADLSGIKV